MNYLPLPEQFDMNEWFIIISIVVSYTIMFLLPKRFPFSVSILMLLFAIFVARTTDEVLAGPNVDLYNVIDSGKYELFDLISYAMYAPFAYFFVYFFDLLKPRGFYLFLYIVSFSLIGWGFEWISAKFQIFTYIEWKFIFSLAVYLVIQPLTLLFFHLVNSVHKESLSNKH
jgi:hypothetical protein